MTWIKICGITNLEDARVVVDAGADALGFVFYEKSPRKVEVGAAREIVQQLPPQIEKVGVFVNQDASAILDVAGSTGLTAVQLHGDDENLHLADLILRHEPRLKVLVGIAMSRPQPEAQAMRWNPENVHAFLLDSGNSTHYGGTGQTFDWETCQQPAAIIAKLGRVIVAGGLTPANVPGALKVLHPWGVDVASGVEARPGKKDVHKVRAFVTAVRQAENKT